MDKVGEAMLTWCCHVLERDGVFNGQMLEKKLQGRKKPERVKAVS